MPLPDHLLAMLQCPRCEGRRFERTGDADAGDATFDAARERRTGSAEQFVCAACRAPFTLDEEVLVVPSHGEVSAVSAEREAVKATERRPELGGINAQFDELHRATGALREALLALPSGDGSRFYEEEGYFHNVRAGANSFSFILDHLALRPGAAHLDVGADCTWSTAHLARKGLRSVALDINHHLKVARLFRERFGVDYSCVCADMHQECFAAESFDVVTAFSALHHSSRLPELCRNLYRMTRPGGEVGFVEPYCTSEEARAEFGAAQKEAGINEGVYTLEEWHGAFTRAGFHLAVALVDSAFHAVYAKPHRASPRGPFTHAYGGEVLLQSGQVQALAPGQAIEIPVLVRNLGTLVWRSQGATPVFLSYHLRRPAAAGDVLVQFDNERTAIPTLAPGTSAVVPLRLRAPTVPGRYVADVDLVQEGVTWFSDRGGVSPRLRLDIA